jgi:hypothetical protein
MANVIGNPFPVYVKSQIEARQFILGLKHRPIEATRYLTNRMPWLRVTSTTNLEKPRNPSSVLAKLEKILGPEAYVRGSVLRKELVLQNFPRFQPPVEGISRSGEAANSFFKDVGFNSIYEDVGFGDEVFFNWAKGAYGYGGAQKRGYVPPPGITNISVQYQNNGGLAKVNVAIKAFSQKQFALIDALYMRPGFSALVEFGWSIYYKQPPLPSSNSTSDGNNFTGTEFGGTISINGFHDFGSSEDTEAFTGVNTGRIGDEKATPYTIYEAINRDRIKYGGNYDAVLGRVTNWKWNLESDGSYSIQLEIQSLGDIIQSMNMNVGAGDTIVQRDESKLAQAAANIFNDKEGTKKSKDFVDQRFSLATNRLKSAFNQFLFDLKVASIEIFRGNTSTALSQYPQFLYGGFEKSTIKVNTSSGGNAIRYPLCFRDFPRPYKATNIKETDTVLEDGSTATIVTKDIIKDRSTPTTFVDGNGALVIPVETTGINAVYISFSSLCAYVQNNLVLYDFTDGKKTPIFYFDDSIYFITKENQNVANGNDAEDPLGEGINYKDVHSSLPTPNEWTDKTYMFTFPGQFSSRPDICLIPVQNTPEILEADLSDIAQGNLNTTLLALSRFSCATQEGRPAQYLGDLGAVYFNTAYLAEVLGTVSTNSQTSILEFFQTILSDMTNALGNVNEIAVFVEEDGGITFFENRPQKFDDDLGIENNAPFTQLNVFGVKPGDDIGDALDGTLSSDKKRIFDTFTQPQGSIVRSFGLSTTIPTAEQTTLVAAAQGNPNQLSSTSTAFGEYNIGLEDITLIEKSNNVPAQTGDFEGELYAEITGSNYTLTQEQLERTIRIKDYISENRPFLQIARKFYDSPTTKYTPAELETLQEFNTQYANLLEGELSKAGQVRSNFFLPFNLKLTLDGIAGISALQKFIIEDKALPPSYGEGGIDIIVKNVNHTVDQNGWITELETQATAVRKLQPPSVSAEIITPPPLPVPTGGAVSITEGEIDEDSLALANTPNPGTISRVKNLVAKFESRGRYGIFNYGNSGYSGASSDGLVAYPAGGVSDITTQTFEWINTKFQRSTGEGQAFATGKYQIIPNTMQSFLSRHPEFKTKTFNQVNQELLGDYLFTEKRSSSGNYLLGNNDGTQRDLENALQDIGYEFASMPIITKDGTTFGNVVTGNGNKAYYGGSGPNPDNAKVTVKTMVIALIGSRIDRTGANPSFIPSYYPG